MGTHEDSPPAFGVLTRDSLGSPVEESPHLVNGTIQL
ncbi:MAG: hypothetical protein ACD_40C00222G0001 [uncultured bacterium]|nr:MAG: hypothetical protein ACD_40C00222G0001 [uncultured bacterium]